MIGIYLTFIALNIACVLLMFNKDAKDYGRTLIDQLIYDYVGTTFGLKLCIAGIMFVPFAGVLSYLKYMSED